MKRRRDLLVFAILAGGFLGAATITGAIDIVSGNGWVYGTASVNDTITLYWNTTKPIDMSYTDTNTQPLTLSGGATVWNDFAVMSTNLAPGVFAPTLTNFNNTAFYCYAGTVRNEYSYGATELFHDWKEGSTLYPHVHTIPSTAGPANYTFKLNYTLYDSTHQTNGVTYVNITDTAQNLGIHGFNTSINATGYGIGSTIGFTLSRQQDDPFDTYTSCVGVAQVSVHYEIDTLGSSSLYTK